jgi:hypothetical protein
MKTKAFKRFAAVTASLMALALTAAPMGLAGEDEDDGEDVTSSGGGGSDSGSASGGVQTGMGGMVASSEPGTTIPLALAGGGVALLTLGGLASRKRRFE